MKEEILQILQILCISDTTEIQRITTEYYKQLYVIKFNNLEEMHKFLETCSLS